MADLGFMVYSEGHRYILPINLESLPDHIRALYEPFRGLVVGWMGGEIVPIDQKGQENADRNV